ncbi:MAG: portal protein [Akkermansia sp.]
MQKLASGHMSYITPSHDVWFMVGSDDREATRREAWYNQCSKLPERIVRFNFYTEIHECFLTVALGPKLFTGTSGRKAVVHQYSGGQFACAENAEGRVDTYVREFAYTAHQARSMFGVKAWGPRLGKFWSAEATVCHKLRFLRGARTRRSRRRSRPPTSV